MTIIEFLQQCVSETTMTPEAEKWLRERYPGIFMPDDKKYENAR